MNPTRRQRLRAETDRVAGWCAVGAGVITLVVGTSQLSRSPYAAEQVTFLINGGLAALAILATGITLLLVADLRDEHDKLRRLGLALEGRTASRLTGGALGPSTTRRLRGAVWAACLGVAAVGLTAGWCQASTAVRLEDALDGLVPAALGLGVAVAACGVQGFAAWQAVARRRNMILASAHVVPMAPSSELSAASLHEWTVPGLGRSHRWGCPALRFADGDPVPAPLDVPLETCLICHREA